MISAPALNYRSHQDLERAIFAKLDRIPPDIDLIIGIPRSGLLAANLLALHLNLPLADLHGFLNGRLLARGNLYGRQRRVERVADCRRVLTIDDSVGVGTTLAQAKALWRAAGTTVDALWAAVYVTPASAAQVDLAFELCPHPRQFAWSIMRHRDLAATCLDIDGVLCRNPSREEDDDGDRYGQFLDGAAPLSLPQRPVHALVTCRLERYRAKTEAWLARHQVRYDHLIMLDLPSKAARRQANGNGRFKAEAYRATPCQLFIESNPREAAEIARLSARPVLCWSEQQLISSAGPHRPGASVE